MMSALAMTRATRTIGKDSFAMVLVIVVLRVVELVADVKWSTRHAIQVVVAIIQMVVVVDCVVVAVKSVVKEIIVKESRVRNLIFLQILVRIDG